MELVLIRYALAVLKFPRKVNDLIIYLKAIYLAMHENPNFEDLEPQLATFLTHIGTLQTHQEGMKTKPPTYNAATRNASLKIAKGDAKTLRNGVQPIADLNSETAEAVILSAAMFVKHIFIKQKQVFSATNGVDPGVVDLVGDGGGPHNFRMSTDGIIWINLESNSTSKLTVTGLTSGTEYHFQNRSVLPHNKKTPWSQSIKLKVN